MLTVKRLDSFSDAQKEWQDLEKQTIHYPFQAFWYQKLFAETFCKAEDVCILGIFDNQTLLAIGGFERVGDKMLFLGMKQVLGNQDLTDYGDILFHKNIDEQMAKNIWGTIVEYFKELGIKELQLDFVREDSLTYRSKQSAFAKATVYLQEVAPYLVVPNSWDEYLLSLGRKQRHELKRKIKRFEEQEAFHFCSKETLHDDFKEFVRLHRLSDGAKEKFMSDEMEKFFWDIVMADKNSYRVDFCSLQMDGKCVASIMSFVGEGRALLYNSGFDPEYAYYSVGLILHSYLIKK